MGGAGKSRQMDIPLGTDIWTVLTQLIITGVYKTYALMFLERPQMLTHALLSSVKHMEKQ